MSECLQDELKASIEPNFHTQGAKNGGFVLAKHHFAHLMSYKTKKIGARDF